MRHVEVKIAEAPRRIGHAGETKIRAVGEQRRFVGGGIAGAQMYEPIGESGPPIDIAQILGDPGARQHPVRPKGQIARGLRNDGRGAGDEELAVLNLATVEFSAPSAVRPRRSGARATRGWRCNVRVTVDACVARGPAGSSSPRMPDSHGCQRPRCRCPSSARAAWQASPFRKAFGRPRRSRRLVCAIGGARRWCGECFPPGCRRWIWPKAAHLVDRI
jgi:hypothetical protein